MDTTTAERGVPGINAATRPILLPRGRGRPRPMLGQFGAVATLPPRAGEAGRGSDPLHSHPKPAMIATSSTYGERGSMGASSGFLSFQVARRRSLLVFRGVLAARLFGIHSRRYRRLQAQLRTRRALRRSDVGAALRHLLPKGATQRITGSRLLDGYPPRNCFQRLVRACQFPDTHPRTLLQPKPAAVPQARNRPRSACSLDLRGRTLPRSQHLQRDEPHDPVRVDLLGRAPVVSGPSFNPHAHGPDPYQNAGGLIWQVSVFVRARGPGWLPSSTPCGLVTRCFLIVVLCRSAQHAGLWAAAPMRNIWKCSVFKHGTLRYT